MGRFPLVGVRKGEAFVPRSDQCTPALFVSCTNKQVGVKRATISAWVRNEFARAGVFFKRTHDVKTWVVTKLLAANYDMRTVADLVNHTISRTIERYYKKITKAEAMTRDLVESIQEPITG
eukprot:Nk52_evm17s225 gene=Nk52_evmTU17s225